MMGNLKFRTLVGHFFHMPHQLKLKMPEILQQSRRWQRES